MLLENDLILFKIRPNLYYENRLKQNAVPDSRSYEYNVDHLVELGFYLPDKPPIKASYDKITVQTENYEPYQSVLDPASLNINNKNLLSERSLTDIVTKTNVINDISRNSIKKTSEQTRVKPAEHPKIGSQMQRRESFKKACKSEESNNQNEETTPESITSISSVGDSEDGNFDVAFYKYRRDVEEHIYYIDDTFRNEAL